MWCEQRTCLKIDNENMGFGRVITPGTDIVIQVKLMAGHSTWTALPASANSGIRTHASRPLRCLQMECKSLIMLRSLLSPKDTMVRLRSCAIISNTARACPGMFGVASGWLMYESRGNVSERHDCCNANLGAKYEEDGEKSKVDKRSPW